MTETIPLEVSQAAIPQASEASQVALGNAAWTRENSAMEEADDNDLE